MSARMSSAVALAMLIAVTAQASPPSGIKQWSPPPKALPVHEGHGNGAATSGIINSVDAVHRTVNFSHKAIPAFGWPTMTMDFPVADDVDLTQIKPGMHVDATLVREGGKATVDTLRPIASR